MQATDLRQPSRRSVLTGLPALIAGAGSASPDAGVQARMADQFVETIGVNVHLFPDSSYVRDRHFDRIILPSLRELGVRHVRDGLTMEPGFLARLERLHAMGIRSSHGAEPQDIAPEQVRAFLRQVGGRARVAMLEGINEPDGYWDQPRFHPGEATDVAAVRHQAALRAAASGTGVPLAASAVIRVDNAPRYAGQRRYSDYGNCHPYPGGHCPETRGWGDEGANGPPGFRYGSLEWARNNIAYAVAGSDKPFVATEAGYHNAITSKAKAANGHLGCSEAAAAKYEPRLFLHYFNVGVLRTFHYELFDQGIDPDEVEHHFGWVRNDGSKKPAFVAMCNLIAVLSDPGPSFAPGRLQFDIPDAPEGLETCLLQKRSKEWFLALWLAKESWDVADVQPVEQQSRSVSINFAQRVTRASLAVPGRDAVFRPLSLSGTTIVVDVSDEVALLRIN